MTILAIGNEKKCATIEMNSAATAIDTANEPRAAPRKPTSIRNGVLAKREPTRAPSVTTDALPIHHGSTA